MKSITIKAVLLLIIACTDHFSQAQNIQLKKYNDSQKQGFESIVFERTVGKNADGSDRKEKVEYNIQENNPYENLNFPSLKKPSNGLKKYEITKSQAESIFNNNIDISNIPQIVAYSHTWLELNKNAVIISYNLFGYRSTGEELGLRKSTIKIINQNSTETFSTEIDTDSYGIQLSPNSKYFGYGYGENTHDIDTKEFGYRIINIEQNSEVVDIPIRILDISYSKYDFLILRGYKNSVYYTWIFDQRNSSLYELKGKFRTASEKSFTDYAKSTIISDLSPYKIK